MFLRRLALFALMLCTGCSAQSTAPAKSAQPGAAPANSADVTQRVQRQLRNYFNLPAEVTITLGSRTASDFPDYETLPVTLSHDGKTQTINFLIAKDNSTLLRVTKLDLTKDPYAETMKKIDIAGRPVRGNPNAKITIVNYDDFECPFCSRMHTTLMSEVLQEYGDKVKIIYKDYPLPMHPWAKHAANDANCLAQQSGPGYWDFADYVHANQHAISGPQNNLQQSFEQLDKLTLDVGKKYNADANRLQACIKTQSDTALKASIAEGDSIGVSATPTMFVNGQRLEGAVDIGELKAALNQQLLAAGVTPPAPPMPAHAETSK